MSLFENPRISIWHKSHITICDRTWQSYVRGADGRITTVFRAIPVFRCETKDFTRRRVGMPSAAIFDRCTSDSGIVRTAREVKSNRRMKLRSPTFLGNFLRARNLTGYVSWEAKLLPPSAPLPRHFFSSPCRRATKFNLEVHLHHHGLRCHSGLPISSSPSTYFITKSTPEIAMAVFSYAACSKIAQCPFNIIR